MWLVKCDGCDKVQEAPNSSVGIPFTPENERTREQWYSRVKDGKVEHACCRQCLKKIGGVVAPW